MINKSPALAGFCLFISILIYIQVYDKRETRRDSFTTRAGSADFFGPGQLDAGRDCIGQGSTVDGNGERRTRASSGNKGRAGAAGRACAGRPGQLDGSTRRRIDGDGDGDQWTGPGWDAGTAGGGGSTEKKEKMNGTTD